MSVDGIPELLAPAGSIECGLTAFDAGADAVYAGLSRFNARERGQNLTNEDLSKLISYARKHGRKVYVTMNTLIKDAELPEAGKMLAELAALRPDAVLVQDLGLVRMIREFFPVLDIHASTQMGVHNSAGANMAQKLGIKRVILERQVTFEEIAEIKRKTSVELEAFVHGALCCSRSGACLLSSWMGGWSGNRGKCKQPCRRRYHSEQGNGFFFSTADLYSLDAIPALKDLGVASLKIEGRLRRADYVSRVVSAYRMVLDAPDDASHRVLKEARSVLSGSLGRKWSAPFRTADDFTGVIQHEGLGASGLLCGKVVNSQPKGFAVEVSRPFGVGDTIRLQPQSGDEGPAITVTRITVEQRSVRSAKRGQRCWVHCDKAVPASARVFKIASAVPDMGKRLAALTTARPTVDMGIRIEGNTIRVQITSPGNKRPCPEDGALTGAPPTCAMGGAAASLPADAEAGVPPVRAQRRNQGILTLPQGPEFEEFTEWSGTVTASPAKKRPLTSTTLAEEFSRSGTSGFAAGKITAEIPYGIFIPASELKQLRRDFWAWVDANIGVEAASKQGEPMLEEFIKSLSDQPLPVTMKPEVVVTLGPGGSNFVPDSITARGIDHLEGDTDEAILPDFCPEGELPDLKACVQKAIAIGVRRFRVTSLYGFSLLAEHEDLTLTAGFPFPICNRAAVEEAQALGAMKTTLWVELDKGTVETLVERYGPSVEVLSYGRIPLLTTRFEIPAEGRITDGRGASFDIVKENNQAWLFSDKVLAIPCPDTASEVIDLTHANPNEPKQNTFNYFRDFV
ncbi:MAG: U32 family peptidase [Kiritimatiellia bacterium]|nr:U32 family peptidase [Kiritimatiellia bacterium]